MNLKINSKKLLAFALVSFTLTTGCAKKDETIAVYQTPPQTTNQVVYQKTSDEIIIEEFEQINKDIEEYNKTNDPKIKQKIEASFIKIVDFLFYDEPIRGITLGEITDETKVQLLKITDKVDQKITKKWPNYKENISEKSNKTYNFVKDKLEIGISKTDNYLENKLGEEKYENIKEKASDAKDRSKEIYSEAKDGASKTLKKVKNWYENKRSN